MFEIYNGTDKFTQWTKDNKLIMNELPVGAEVLFYNDPNEDEPQVAEVYEMQDGDKTIHVCNIPNILLTRTNKIKVRVPEKVKGLYGNVHKIVGNREKYFEIMATEKPADYIDDPVTDDSLTEADVITIIKEYHSSDTTDLPYASDESVDGVLTDVFGE